MRPWFRFCDRLVLLALAAVLIGAADARPPMPEEAVSVKIGREVAVTFMQAEDRLVSPTVLPNAVEGDSVLTVKLEQNGRTCTLFVTNGFSQTLNYRMLIRYRGTGSFVDSVVVPVKAYRQGVMSFGTRVEEVVLYEFRLGS